MKSLHVLQNELFNNSSLKTAHTLALTPKKNKSLNLNFFESCKIHVTQKEINCTSLLIIDDYEKPLGSVRLIINNVNLAKLEFSNGITTPIENGIDADELGNILYTLFGKDKQKIRITLYLSESTKFSKELQEVKEGYTNIFETASKLKITHKIFNRNLEIEMKKSKCFCKSWGLCGADEGRKCNGLTGTCSGRCLPK